jgi:threonine/homoserine/homoserine lactone efflux protein
MKQPGKIFFYGFVISFLGSLPLGMMNVTVTNIALTKGTVPGWWFAAGAILIEVVYVKIAISTMHLLFRWQGFIRVFEWLTFFLILALSLSGFNNAIKMRGFGSWLPINNITPFIAGIALSLMNPLHMPFWIGWSTVLTNKKILTPGRLSYNAYVTGIAGGSFAGFAVFILGSHFAAAYLKSNQTSINYIIACVLFITAVLQLYKLIQKATINRLLTLAG